MASDKRVPGHSIAEWSRDLLLALGAPTNETNIRTLITWANVESGGYNPSRPGGRFNPLNTTEDHFGSAGQGGSQGNIKDFASYSQGIQNQAWNLLHAGRQGGRDAFGYQPIVDGLRKGNAPDEVFQAINRSAFGTHFGAHTNLVPLTGADLTDIKLPGGVTLPFPGPTIPLTPGGIAGIASPLAGALGNNDIFQAFRNLVEWQLKLADPRNWKRSGLWILGCALAALGIYLTVKDTASALLPKGLPGIGGAVAAVAK